MYEELKQQAAAAAREIMDIANLETGDILVVGCSSSEAGGKRIGSDSSEEIGRALFTGIWEEAKRRGVYVAAQCCEHLNRALIIEAAAAKMYGLPRVNAVPQRHAGGAFAMAAYAAFEQPYAVEELHCARAGLDIGDTLIGMHIAKVCVPVRLSMSEIGEAHLVACRARPKYVGGPRTVYDEKLY
jgi:uncharacterized protein (TIGR01440 family)